jgi:XisH protein
MQGLDLRQCFLLSKPSMPAKDFYHEIVKMCLLKDGWTITPLPLRVGNRNLFIDLGAEKLLIAQRAQQKIGVEVKSFISESPVADLEQALGQYLLYEDLMRIQYPSAF